MLVNHRFRHAIRAGALAATFALGAPLAAQGPAVTGAALDARVDSLLARMTLEEKVGQMTQVTLQVVGKEAERGGTRLVLDSVKLEEAIVRRHVGAILNVYDQAVTPETWRTVIETIERFARRGRVPVPVLYGIDAVHGNNYQLG